MSFDIAGFAQSFAKRNQTRSSLARNAAKPTDHRHRLLLRAGGERHRNRRTASKSDELPRCVEAYYLQRTRFDSHGRAEATWA
jgi:hypothetical protein